MKCIWIRFVRGTLSENRRYFTMEWKPCPKCGKNNWRKVEREKPNDDSLATKTVIVWYCLECGHEENV